MRLDGVQVLDLTRLLPGPYATQLLAYAGADVVKIEDTGAGDYARELEPRTDRDVGAIFDGVNRGKRSVTLDLKSATGTEIFYDMAEDADVVIEGFRPGVVDRLGVGYDKLRAHNPDIVYCSLSGYGQDGPYADQVGHDLNYIGIAGFLGMNRKDASETPRVPGFPIGDMSGGLFAAYAIVGALLSRELGNTRGRYIDVSMTDVIASFSQHATAYVEAGVDVAPGTGRINGGYACYNVYEAADGEFLSVAALEPKFWREFCRAIGRDELIDHHLASDDATREATVEAVTDTIAMRPRSEWLERFEETEATVAPVHDVTEALDDPQLTHRMPDAEGITRVALPLAHAGSTLDASVDVPGQGEHTEEVLRERGYTAADIDRLQEENVI